MRGYLFFDTADTAGSCFGLPLLEGIPMEETEIQCTTMGPQMLSHCLTKFRLPPSASPEPKDVTYSFSVTGGGPETAAVLLSVVIFAGKKRVEGVVKPIAKAIDAYNKARDSGHGAALVSGSNDIFRVDLGKLCPGQTVSVIVTTLTPILNVGDTLVATIPLALEERYAPAGYSAPLPPAKPPVMSAVWDLFASKGADLSSFGSLAHSAHSAHSSHPSSAPTPTPTVASGTFAGSYKAPKVKVQAVVDLGVELAALTCPSHCSHVSFTLTADPDASHPHRSVVTIDGVSPDKDFVLVMTPRDPNCSLLLREELCLQSPVFASLEDETVAKECGATTTTDACPSMGASVEYAKTTAVSVSMRVNLTPEGSFAPTISPGAFVFVADLSGSMDPCIPALKEALKLAVASIPAGSLFQIIYFGNYFRKVFDSMMVYDDASKMAALQSINGISANMGGTELCKALDEALKVDSVAGMPVRVVVLTDGEVERISDIVDLVKGYCSVSDKRVVALGLGDTVSTALVNEIARAGRGRSLFSNSGDLPTTMMKLLGAAANGSLRDVKVSVFPPELEALQVSGMTSTERPYPMVFSGERFTFNLVFAGTVLPPDAKVVVSAAPLAGSTMPLTWTLPLNTAATVTHQGKALHAQAALAACRSLQELDPESEMAVEIACKYGVVTKGTAMVAVWSRDNEHDTALAKATKTPSHVYVNRGPSASPHSAASRGQSTLFAVPTSGAVRQVMGGPATYAAVPASGASYAVPATSGGDRGRGMTSSSGAKSFSSRAVPASAPAFAFASATSAAPAFASATSAVPTFAFASATSAVPTFAFAPTSAPAPASATSAAFSFGTPVSSSDDDMLCDYSPKEGFTFGSLESMQVQVSSLSGPKSTTEFVTILGSRQNAVGAWSESDLNNLPGGSETVRQLRVLFGSDHLNSTWATRVLFWFLTNKCVAEQALWGMFIQKTRTYLMIDARPFDSTKLEFFSWPSF
jgi:hypothetical protein